MEFPKKIRAIEAQLSEQGVGLDDFLGRVGVHRTNWLRWRRGETMPHMRNWMSVEAALSEFGINDDAGAAA